MRRLIISLDDDLDPWMAKQINQNETVRKALMLYKGDITTDTLEGMRASYRQTRTDIAEMKERFTELYDLVESTNNTIQELANR